jgi:hypothetical protein
LFFSFVPLVVIKLEGGTDFDLTILDRAPSPERKLNVSHEDEKEVASSSDSKRERRKGRSQSRSQSPLPNRSKDNKGRFCLFVFGISYLIGYFNLNLCIIVITILSFKYSFLFT